MSNIKIAHARFDYSIGIHVAQFSSFLMSFLSLRLRSTPWAMAALSTLLLVACTGMRTDGSPLEPARPGEVKVIYSQTDSSLVRLKEAPTEVMIVRRADTSKAAAAQVGVALVMLLAGGGAGIRGFSKDELRGSPIEWSGPREFLRNPVPTGFVETIAARVSAAVAADAELQANTYTHPVIVAGGNARLIYEDLMGTDEEKYRLHLRLEIYKRRELANRWSARPNTTIDCSFVSATPLPELAWARNDYKPVQDELARALATCEERFDHALLTLLERSRRLLQKPVKPQAD